MTLINKIAACALLLAMAVVAGVLLPGTVSAQDPREQVTLEVSTPEETPLGNLARIVAVLKDSRGEPIPGATIVLTTPALFAGTAGEMALGEIKTDSRGVATLDYQLRVEGQNQFIGRFHGNGLYQPSEDSATVTATGSVQLSERSAGVEVPFLGSWTLVAVLLSVWSVYFLAMLLVSQIPETMGRQG